MSYVTGAALSILRMTGGLSCITSNVTGTAITSQNVEYHQNVTCMRYYVTHSKI